MRNIEKVEYGKFLCIESRRGNSMSNFYLNQEDKFIIYGAGGNCYHLISALEQQGKQIVGIIDKRADSLQDVMGIPVYSMEQIQTLGLENAVIILSIKNVFMHTEIAEQLVQLGFSKLIYKPLPILQGIEDGEWKSVDKVYDALVEHEIFLGDIGVFFSDKNHMRVWQNRLLISRTDEGVICWLPIELLHNYDRENDIFARLPMAAYYPLVQLYSFLLGNKTGLTWNEVQRDYLLYSAEWVYKRQLEFTNDLKKSQID